MFNVTLTNRGLITAKDVQLLLPEGLKALVYDQLDNNEPFHLTPGQSVQIPVRITHRENAGEEPAKVKPIDDDPCVNQVGTLLLLGLRARPQMASLWNRSSGRSCYSPDRAPGITPATEPMADTAMAGGVAMADGVE